MKTSPDNQTQIVLLAIYEMKDHWMTVSQIASFCVFAPEVLQRKKSSSVGDTISQKCKTLFERGSLQKRKAKGTLNEYKLTEKGIAEAEKLKQQKEQHS